MENVPLKLSIEAAAIVLSRREHVSGMQFIHHDLGYRRAGEIVEISLSGNAANVRLLDNANFTSYRNGRRHQYIGGLTRRSPVRLQIPRAGAWHLVVDLQGLRGSVRSSVRVLPGPLPPLRVAPLSSVPSLVQHALPGQSADVREYDVFISHASADRDEVVRPLAHALSSGGLRVSYDEFELRSGDSLRRKIDAGLTKSRFGIVVLSHSFFAERWPSDELEGLVIHAVSGEQIVLPIWHRITKQEVIAYSPSLAEKLTRSTATHTIDEIASEIVGLLHSN